MNVNKKYLTPREGTDSSYIFTECATFADEIKYHGGGYQSDWHFHDEPFLDQGGKISDFPDYKEGKYTVTDAISGISKWFKKSSGYTNDYYYQQIHSSGYPTGATEQELQSVAMRLLIHYVGDQHQPLHSESRVDKQYPAGDRGGNSVPLTSHYNCKELHCVWDRVVYEFKTNQATPFDSSSYTSFTNMVKALMNRHPVSSLDNVNNLDPNTWQAESFAMTKSFVYNGVHENSLLPSSYVTDGVKLAEKRLVTAGYRLAHLLKSLNISSEEPVAATEPETAEAEEKTETVKPKETPAEDPLFLQ